MAKKLVTMGLMVLVLTLGLVGCGNSVVKKSIAQAKTLMESKNYDKALLSLELALDEDKENKEANKLHSIITTYIKAKKLAEANDVNGAKKVLGAIDSEYKNYAIKGDVDKLKTDIDKKIKEIEAINNEIKKLLSLVDNKKYDEAKVVIQELNKKKLTEEQKGKIKQLQSRIDSELAKIQAEKEEARIQEKAMEEEEIRKEEQANKSKASTEAKSTKNKQPARFSIPSLNKTANSTEELAQIFNSVGKPFEYVDNSNGITYSFNPWSTKADGYNK